MRYLVLGILLVGCGADLRHVDFLDVVEPIDDAAAPYSCTSAYFKLVESEAPISCAAYAFDERLAVTYVLRLTAIRNDADSYLRILKRTTVHVRDAHSWQSKLGDGEVVGYAWFDRIDVGRDLDALAHETLHIYDLAHWRLDTGQHPGWDRRADGAVSGSDNYTRADIDYADYRELP